MMLKGRLRIISLLARFGALGLDKEEEVCVFFSRRFLRVTLRREPL